LIALALNGAADEFFVSVRAVDVGSVEEGDAEFEGAVMVAMDSSSSRPL